MPPVSKVMPFPTNASLVLEGFEGRNSNVISLGGWALPLPTLIRPTCPAFLRLRSFKTETLSQCFFPVRRARSAKICG